MMLLPMGLLVLPIEVHRLERGRVHEPTRIRGVSANLDPINPSDMTVGLCFLLFPRFFRN